MFPPTGENELTAVDDGAELLRPVGLLTKGKSEDGLLSKPCMTNGLSSTGSCKLLDETLVFFRGRSRTKGGAVSLRNDASLADERREMDVDGADMAYEALERKGRHLFETRRRRNPMRL